MSMGSRDDMSPPSQSANVKKKRRTSANNAIAQHLFVPQPSAGFNDTLVANNPFDDIPRQEINPAMLNPPPPPVHSNLPSSSRNCQPQEQNPMQVNFNLVNPMMPCLSNVAMIRHTNRMGPVSNHCSSTCQDSVKSSAPNPPQYPLGAVTNHMNMTVGRIINSQMNSPVTGTINYASDNPGVNMNFVGIGRGFGTLGTRALRGTPGMNSMNGACSFNPAQCHFNQMNKIRDHLTRLQGGPMANVNPVMAGGMPRPNSMPNINMMRPQINNVVDVVNINQRNQLSVTANAMNTVECNPTERSRMNMENPNLQNDFQGFPPHCSKSAASDKVFPADQPIIFDQENPHAPPISPCGVCHKEVNADEQAIFCESGCNFWFHRRCTGLTESAYSLMMQEAYAEWVCDKCLQTKNIPLVKFKS